MGTSGPGNIVHIDNLYVKTFNVQDDVNIVLGEFLVVEATGVRPLVDGDVTAPAFFNLDTLNIVQAGENANNLTTTDALLKKNQIECITKGSDWVVDMGVDVLPDSSVGIFAVSETPIVTEVRATTTGSEILGVYKHKEFSTVAVPSLLNEDGVISTGLRS